MLTAVLCILALGLIGLNLLVGFYLFRQHRKSSATQADLLSQFQKELASLKEGLHGQILGVTRDFHTALNQNQQSLVTTQNHYQETVNQVQHRLGELHQATQSMIEISRDISSLQDILQAPKLRGGLGEMLLAEILRQILPADHFTLQYSFRNASKVDAVIMLGEGLIPVDAKFPLENFKRILEAKEEDSARQARKTFIQDVKKHVDSIASKYILPEEGTFDFALMYIPAENVYYETIIREDYENESLCAYAAKKRVFAVSPNSFYPYLLTIMRGLKGLRIEKSAQLMLETLGQLETDFVKCMADFSKLGTHLGNAQSSFQNTEKRLTRLQDKLAGLERPAALPGPATGTTESPELSLLDS